MTDFTTNPDKAVFLDDEDNAELQAAKMLKKHQSKVTKRYNFLSKVDTRHFQAEYVRVQAQEICNYVRDLAITPLNALYNDMYKHFTNTLTMHQFYIQLNEFGGLEPDEDRINSLILPEKDVDDD